MRNPSLPRPKTGVPRDEVSEEVALMLLDRDVAGFDIRLEPGGTYSVTPLGIWYGPEREGQR